MSHPLNHSRDKTVIVWKLDRSETNYGVAHKALKGHSHFVQDVVISSDGQVRALVCMCVCVGVCENVCERVCVCCGWEGRGWWMRLAC
jgi:hypothetical protein